MRVASSWSRCSIGSSSSTTRLRQCQARARLSAAPHHARASPGEQAIVEVADLADASGESDCAEFLPQGIIGQGVGEETGGDLIGENGHTSQGYSRGQGGK
ncbi:hypothetical protein GCM10007874_72960 [Labrys miyagiensis]|uniref:Uncharacterized protein n=1 Tax=Labrys miyagiensis TaxID=346912 RepID=A0ABQ6CX63_9HYPH|nr:hypothetical protein GCM10007874_72960 [Labrys miyagiensis]